MSATRIVVTPDQTGSTAPAQQGTVTGKPAAETLQSQTSGQTQQAQQPTQDQRPQWLPEKFKSPEDLATAYAELEKKQSGQQTVQKTDGQQAQQTQQQTDPKQDKAFEPFFKEFAEKGQLSDESYASLAKQGITKQMVDAYSKGLQSDQAALETRVFESVGGKDQYGKVTEWAAQNLTAAEISAFNSTLDSGNAEMISLAAQGLAARYQSVVGKPAQLVRGEASGAANASFRSTAEIRAAMNDPRYRSDPAYRDEVAGRLANSTVL
jgi:hypothetical protein